MQFVRLSPRSRLLRSALPFPRRLSRQPDSSITRTRRHSLLLSQRGPEHKTSSSRLKDCHDSVNQRKQLRRHPVLPLLW